MTCFNGPEPDGRPAMAPLFDNLPEPWFDWRSEIHWEALHPFGAGGAYPTFMMDGEGPDRLRQTFGTNYPRLAAVKRRYDPENVFRRNQNIRPA